MTKDDIYRWKTNEVTVHLHKLLTEAKDLKKNEILSLGVGTEDLEKTFLYLKGYVEGIDLFLEAELEEAYEEETI